MIKYLLSTWILFNSYQPASAQPKEDSIAVRQAVLDYIESQHNAEPSRMERALHPRMVKRTFWKDLNSGKEFVRETNTESMIILSETYNKSGKRFPTTPLKQVTFLDMAEQAASVKLLADEWFDYIHLVKINNSWKIINVLWQYHETEKHQN